MINKKEELALDEDGIPILMDIVRDSQPLQKTHQDTGDHAASLSPAEITDELLRNETFQHQLNEVAAVLTRNVRQQTEQSLKAAIELAIMQALDNSSGSSFNAIREQLEISVPQLLAKCLTDDKS